MGSCPQTEEFFADDLCYVTFNDPPPIVAYISIGIWTILYLLIVVRHQRVVCRCVHKRLQQRRRIDFFTKFHRFLMFLASTCWLLAWLFYYMLPLVGAKAVTWLIVRSVVFDFFYTSADVMIIVYFYRESHDDSTIRSSIVAGLVSGLCCCVSTVAIISHYPEESMLPCTSRAMLIRQFVRYGVLMVLAVGTICALKLRDSPNKAGFTFLRYLVFVYAMVMVYQGFTLTSFTPGSSCFALVLSLVEIMWSVALVASIRDDAVFLTKGCVAIAEHVDSVSKLYGPKNVKFRDVVPSYTGGEGTVWRVQLMDEDPNKVSMIKLHKDGLESLTGDQLYEAVRNVIAECLLLEKLDHKNIIKSKGFFVCSNPLKRLHVDDPAVTRWLCSWLFPCCCRQSSVFNGGSHSPDKYVTLDEQQGEHKDHKDDANGHDEAHPDRNADAGAPQAVIDVEPPAGVDAVVGYQQREDVGEGVVETRRTHRLPLWGPVLEYCLHGALWEYMIKNLATYKTKDPAIPLHGNVLRFADEIAEALEYLHREGYVHLDLKLSNVVVDSPESCKIIDFGSAHQIDRLSRTVVKLRSNLYTTQLMAAPELHAHGRRLIGPAADMYSYGIVLLQLCLGLPRIHDLKTLTVNKPQGMGSATQSRRRSVDNGNNGSLKTKDGASININTNKRSSGNTSLFNLYRTPASPALQPAAQVDVISYRLQVESSPWPRLGRVILACTQSEAQHRWSASQVRAELRDIMAEIAGSGSGSPKPRSDVAAATVIANGTASNLAVGLQDNHDKALNIVCEDESDSSDS